MTFQSQLYYGAAAFPWNGRIEPKQFIKFPWLLSVEAFTGGKPVLLDGSPAFISDVHSAQILLIELDHGAASAVPPTHLVLEEVTFIDNGDTTHADTVGGHVYDVSTQDGTVTHTDLEGDLQRIALQAIRRGDVDLRKGHATDTSVDGFTTPISVEEG